MPQLRKPASEISPAYEDAGLFKNEVCQITVDLVPQMSRNARGDLRVRGFVSGTLEIEVLFAGRRAKESGPLEAELKAALSQARRKVSGTARASLEIEDVRCPVRIEGAWRPRFRRDPSGWETRSYNLVAACWSFDDRNGNSVSFGAPLVK